MKALLAFVILIIGLLVYTYYWINITWFNGHIPATFFKSKARRYSLVAISLLCVACSGYLFHTSDWGLGWVFIVILFYVVGYFLVTERIRQDTMIEKIFRAYHAFSLPDVGVKKVDLLPNTAEFSMDWIGYSKQTRKKAMNYINGEIKEGRIKNVFDLPSAIATYFAALANSKDPKSFEKVSFSKERLQKIHDGVYAGTDNRNELRKFFDNVVILIDRNFKNFSLVSYQKPDFAKEEVELIEHTLYKNGRKEKPEHKIMAMFSNVPGNLAYKFGWVNSLEEYMILANLEFARRNPGHYLSKEIKSKYKFSDQEIIDFAGGEELPPGLKFDL